MTVSEHAPAGWYADPGRVAQLRYWDGAVWTAHVHGTANPFPASGGSPPAPAREGRGARVWWTVTAIAAALTVVGLLATFAITGLREAAGNRPGTVTSGPVWDGRSGSGWSEGPGTPVVTPHGAREIFASFWPQREAAIAARSSAQIQALESGSAGRGDLERVRCACPIRRSPGRYGPISVFVPRQTTYPARFMVEAATTRSPNIPWTEVMVFIRASAHARWTLDLDTGWERPAGVAPVLRQAGTDTQGFDPRPSPSTQAQARTVEAALVTYWQAAKREGRVPEPNPFQPGPWTNDMAARLAEHPQGTIQANGLIGHNSYSTEGGGRLYAFTDSRGNEIACGVVLEKVVDTAGPGGAPYQNTDRTNWGPDLRPGPYRSITMVNQWQTCFILSPGADPALVLGGDGLNESRTTGVPRF